MIKPYRIITPAGKLRTSAARIRRSVPWMIRIWYVLIALAVLGIGNNLKFLSGVRIQNQFYYFELLLLPSFLIAIQLPRQKRLKWVWLFLAWVLISAIHGVMAGGFVSMIYDRSRVFAVMFLLILLHKYRISSMQMRSLLPLVLLFAVLGNIITMSGRLGGELDYYLRDVLSFSYMGAAFLAARFRIERKSAVWYFPLIMVPLGYAIFFSSRAKFLCMLFWIVLPFTFEFRKMQLRILAGGIIGILGIVGLIMYGPTDSAFSAKAISGPGLSSESLRYTSEIRLLESEAITGQMSGIQYLIGRGLGSQWISSIYDEQTGIVRDTFHIYYFEIFYKMGAIGLFLFAMVFISPFIDGLRRFRHLDAIGQTGVCCMGALLMGFLSSASATWIEASFYCTALHCIYCGDQRAVFEKSVNACRRIVTTSSTNSGVIGS